MQLKYAAHHPHDPPRVAGKPDPLAKVLRARVRGQDRVRATLAWILDLLKAGQSSSHVTAPAKSRIGVIGIILIILVVLLLLGRI
jgi:hypothetical protein